jgi:hypothetical protein
MAKKPVVDSDKGTSSGTPSGADRGVSPDSRPAPHPESESGLDFYAQGGVVVDGVAYFTCNDYSNRPGIARTEEFPCVVAFDVHTFRKLRAYEFTFTYDSSPLVFQKRDGAWLVIAHEHKKERTVALSRDTGAVEWISAANQPGSMFFGYSYFDCDDGSKLILMACSNGLHAVSSETGQDVWWVEQRSSGGITPCVDQDKGWIFYQCDGKLLKIHASDGEILESVEVGKPNTCVSWNTVLVDDSYGTFVATRWYGESVWDSAIRVYDRDLNLVWERTGLASGKKDTLTYADGKLVCGSGNHWAKKPVESKAPVPKPPHSGGPSDDPEWIYLYEGTEWKHITAYSIADGEAVWKCDLSEIDYGAIANLPYLNGYFYGESNGLGPQTSKCLRINASTGQLEEVLEYGRNITSCAAHIIAHGMVLSGDLCEDRIVATRIDENSAADWPGTFGDPQTNQMAIPDEPNAKAVPMREEGRDAFLAAASASA